MEFQVSVQWNGQMGSKGLTDICIYEGQQIVST
jgi:hypothetical protein